MPNIEEETKSRLMEAIKICNDLGIREKEARKVKSAYAGTTIEDVQKLLDYVNAHGGEMTVEEIMEGTGFTREQVDKIVLVATVERKIGITEII